MVYVSGGYTQAHFNGTIFAPDANAFTTPGTTYSGWFLGSGYEFRFDWLPGLYWRTEYRFNSYNSKDIQLLSGGFRSLTPLSILRSSCRLSPHQWSGGSTGGADLTVRASAAFIDLTEGSVLPGPLCFQTGSTIEPASRRLPDELCCDASTDTYRCKNALRLAF